MKDAALSGKVALVTGASSGIGEATAVALGARGVRVALAARREDRLRSLAKRIETDGGEALPIVAGVSDAMQVKKAVADVVDRWGRLDILVNNAGIALLGPIEAVAVEDWRRMVELNFLGVVFCTHAALPVMKQQGSGHVVNISSLAGRQVSARNAVYSATKFAVGAFSEGLRQQVIQDKIRVTIIEPGAVATEVTDHIGDIKAREKAQERFHSMRTLQADDVAAAIVYAVSQPDHVSVNEILIRPTDEL